MKNVLFLINLLILTLVLRSAARAQVLNKDATLERFSFWQNKDWDWYKANIPFFESPDQDIDLTYYYRWDLTTLHLVYGSPQSGYATTEFIDRPWWAGTYGAISCSVGHHLYDMRWMRDPRYVEQYARYWFKTPGAQPRSYSTWLADATWQLYKVTGNKPFITSLARPFIDNYREWEKEHWIDAEGMFAWSGMHDGMETNINSRQTPQWFEGVSGYRPTLNSYMWADANAIRDMARLTNDEATARLFAQKADRIKTSFQAKCWDPKRDFFIHRNEKDEANGIKANTLTYETGKYAGNTHGREEIGFIPWAFRMPDAGYESAWKFLMDSTYFYAPYGPTTVEKGDPLYHVARNCCAWSGNAWPFATSQTLKAMANVVRYYKQDYVTAADYNTVLRHYALTHRQGNRPYIAEANHPETGSWEGHDVPGHSEHYFHSSFVDLVVTGLMGLEPMASDSVEINPLIPASWDYCCLDDVPYHGNRLAIVWDKTGEHYHRGKGLLVLANDKVIAQSPTITRLVIPLTAKPVAPTAEVMNFAVNNERETVYPRVLTSSIGIGDNLNAKLNDGQYWYVTRTPNRWVSSRPGSRQEWAGIDFGTGRKIHTVNVYLISDSAAGVRVPQTLRVQAWTNQRWQDIPGQKARLPRLQDSRANTFIFPVQTLTKLRVLMDKPTGTLVGLSELEAWGPADSTYQLVANPAVVDPYNLAKPSIARFSSSFRSKFDDFRERDGINDGSLSQDLRWTAYESPNETDWVQFDFKTPRTVSEAHLYVFDDKGGTQPPVAYTVEYWRGNQWVTVPQASYQPEKPVANLNRCAFSPVKTDRLRINLKHQSRKVFSGLYEVALYGPEKQ